MSERGFPQDNDDFDGAVADRCPVVSGPDAQDAIEWLVGGRGEEPVDYFCEATLIPEPQGPRGDAAVAVLVGGMRVGGLDNEISERLTVAFREWECEQITCGALIVGGWYRSAEDKADFQVLLDLSAIEPGQPSVPPADVTQTPQLEAGRRPVPGIATYSMLAFGGLVLLAVLGYVWLGDSSSGPAPAGPRGTLMAAPAPSNVALPASLHAAAPGSDSAAAVPQVARVTPSHSVIPPAPASSPPRLPAIMPAVESAAASPQVARVAPTPLAIAPALAPSPPRLPATTPAPAAAEPADPSPSRAERQSAESLLSSALPAVEAPRAPSGENEAPAVTGPPEVNESSAASPPVPPPDNNPVKLAARDQANPPPPAKVTERAEHKRAIPAVRARQAASQASHRARKWAQARAKKVKYRIYQARRWEPRTESPAPAQREDIMRPPAMRLVDDAFKELFSAPRGMQSGGLDRR